MASSLPPEDPPPDAGESGDDDRLDSRFFKLAQNGGRSEAYQLLLASMSRLRGYLQAKYPCELGGPQGIEDLIHDATWKAVEHAGGFLPTRGGVRVWAFAIGANMAADRVRSEASRRRREASVARTEELVDSDYPSQVRDAIEAMPSPYKEILIFDLESGGTGDADALASRLGVTRQTVYNRRYVARQMLLEYLQ